MNLATLVHNNLRQNFDSVHSGRFSSPYSPKITRKMASSLVATPYASQSLGYLYTRTPQPPPSSHRAVMRAPSQSLRPCSVVPATHSPSSRSVPSKASLANYYVGSSINNPDSNARRQIMASHIPNRHHVVPARAYSLAS